MSHNDLAARWEADSRAEALSYDADLARFGAYDAHDEVPGPWFWEPSDEELAEEEARSAEWLASPEAKETYTPVRFPGYPDADTPF
jgi:hypothetical protein